MKIRTSNIEDIDTLLAIYSYAREFMAKTGNGNQWINGYPEKNVILNDISNGYSYVFENDNHEITGTFCFFVGEDPTYARIDDGRWLNDKPYGVIHRLAGNGKTKGLGDLCLQWCLQQWGNIRVDTHPDNKVMQKIFLRNGFTECGIIYTHNNTTRIAFQKDVQTD